MLNIEIQKRFETLRHIPFCVGQSKFAFGGYNIFFYFYLFSAQQTRKTDRVLQSFKYHNDEEKTFEL